MCVALPKIYAQRSDTTLDVVNWNIEWFGSSENDRANKDLQEQNVVRVLRYLDADMYGLCEVVDTARLHRVVNSLGSDYAYVISDYCSLAASPFDADWIKGQKLAFVYRKSVVSNVQTRGFMRNSPSANYNFASGRLPFVLNANVAIKGVKRNMNFFLLHGKAGSAAADYNRRKAAADEMKDSLDAEYANTTHIIFGDFNDDLDQSIAYNGNAPSSYQQLVQDSTDADHYVAITLPLSYAGVNSTLSYADPIDHQVISNEADSMYVAGSASIRKDIVNVVPDYTSHNTSDHYPVFSQYKMLAGDTSVEVVVVPPVSQENQVKGFIVGPNPARQQLFIVSETVLHNVEVSIFNILGQRQFSLHRQMLGAQEKLQVNIHYLPAGVYFLNLSSKEMTHKVTVVKE